jgi:hypothetical protein
MIVLTAQGWASVPIEMESLGNGLYQNKNEETLDEPGYAGIWATDGCDSTYVDIGIVEVTGMWATGEDCVLSSRVYAALKTSSATYLTVTTGLIPNDDNAAAAKLRWTGEGEEVPGNRRERRVDKSAVGHKTLTASCCDVSLTANVWILHISMVTPSGTTPLPGVNEFTFSAETVGNLTLNVKASVAPTGAATLIKTFCQLSVGNIAGSSKSSSVLQVTGDNLLQTYTFTGLPPDNSSFGNKSATVTFNAIQADQASYEVFYLRDQKNHPGSKAGIYPNWYYYWEQTTANQADGNMTYVSQGVTQYSHVDDGIRMSDDIFN